MPLTDDDIREILRLIDGSDLEELRVETETFSLHVVLGDGGSVPEAVPPPVPAAAATDPSPPAPASSDDLVTIAAPMLGTFYRAEAPGAAPYVDVGSRVEADSVVCLIEVMKMMNAVPAGVAGTVVEVCVENAQLVEYGAPLFQVEPRQGSEP
jgi:acetyl-CoA carboxylase biotin carboxyl carrier protein